MTSEDQAKRLEAAAREMLARDNNFGSWEEEPEQVRKIFRQLVAPYLDAADRAVPVVAQADFDAADQDVEDLQASLARAEEAHTTTERHWVGMWRGEFAKARRAEEAARAFAKALREIANVLGPGAGTCSESQCEGCLCEMAEALELAAEVLAAHPGSEPTPGVS